MPARHKSPQDDLPKRQFQSEGSGRRKRVSARHQVKRLDRISEELAPPKPVRQKKQVFFVRCGSPQGGLQFHRGESSQVKSGPDVFADALVPRNVLVPRNGLCSDSPRFWRPALLDFQIPTSLSCSAPPALRLRRRLSAMVIVVRSPKVNRIQRSQGKACAAATSAIRRPFPVPAHLHPVHRDT
jgi:hypothetical protein